MNISPSFLLLLTLSIPLTGCREAPQQPAASQLVIGVSVAPQAWLVERLGEDRVEILTMVPPAASPATYQPSDAQVSRLLAADAYLRIGVPCEKRRWFSALEDSGQVEIIDQAAGIHLLPIDQRGDSPAHPPELPRDLIDGDPHIWLSPPLLAIQAHTVATLLARLDPAHAAQFRTNLAQLERELDSLDRSLHETLAPLAGSRFFVFHPSWGYFADRYGLQQVAIELDGKEPTDHQLTVLQQQAHDSAASAIFVQPQIAGRSAEAVAEAIGARLVVLDPMAPDVLANLSRTAEELVADHSQRAREHSP